MAEITKRNLVLTFGTKDGKELNLTITKPREDLADGEISAAMTEIIAANTLGADSLVTTKVEANYVIQQKEAVSLV